MPLVIDGQNLILFPEIIVGVPLTGVPIKLNVTPLAFLSLSRTETLTQLSSQVETESATASGLILLVIVTLAWLQHIPFDRL